MRFVHEIIPDPVNGDTEIVNINGTQFPIADFLSMESGYTTLPVGVKGINYIPDLVASLSVYYSYDLSGNIIDAHIPAETLDGFLAKAETYKEQFKAAIETLAVQEWDTGTVEGNRAKRIKEIKLDANVIRLSKTDWYFIRNQETAKSIPQSVLDHRSAVRQAVVEAESAVAKLSDLNKIKNVEVNWPTDE